MRNSHAQPHCKYKAKDNKAAPLPKPIAERRVPIDISKIFQIINKVKYDHHHNGKDTQSIQNKEAVYMWGCCRHIIGSVIACGLAGF